MNCQEVHEQLHPFLDGELPPSEAALLEQSLGDCPDCQTELAEMRAVRSLAREAFETSSARAVEAADFSDLFGGVMARLEAEGALRTAPEAAAEPAVAASRREPSLLDRLMVWFGQALTFEQPMASLGLAAIVALMGAGVYWMQTQGGAGPGLDTAPRISHQGDTPRGPTPRRGMELEHRNAADVESVEVAAGRVEIDDATEDPDKPMVVWHIVEGGGETAEQGL